jgi:predicted nucleotidyltransferase
MIRVSVSAREVLVGRCYRVPLERLGQFPWSRYVKFAFLFGSAARGAPARDLDIAIPAVDLDAYSELLGELALWLGMSEDYIDLMKVREDAP